VGFGAPERLILYWYSEYSNEGAPERSWERDCFLAEVDPNPGPSMDDQQRLLDGGYMTAWRYDDRENLVQITNPQLRKVDPDDIVIELTEAGEEEAYAFYEFVWSDEGRARSLQFAKQRVADETKQLGFRVIVPDDVSPNFDPLPDALVYPENDTVTLRYYEEIDDQLFIDETTQELGEDEMEFDKESTRVDRIAGVRVDVRERQLTDAWAELSMSWQIAPVSYRLSYHRTVASAEQAADVADEDADGYAGEVEAESPEVDSEMREDSRRAVASMIMQA
jgi:hypothetical protein